MLDTVERQWHTASIVGAVKGEEVEPWDDLHARFDEYLNGEQRSRTEDEEKRWLLGLG
jgi:hypothetical protein